MSNGTLPKAVGMQAYRAPSLFQPHRARDAIADAHAGKIAPLLGYIMGFSSIQVARVVAQFGYDWAWIDWEHNPMDLETMTTLVHEIQFMSEGKTIAFVRVPSHDHAAIGYALDAGASIIVPQVETVTQAKHIISAAKFGSKNNGTRSAPPARFLPYLNDTPINPSLTLHENLNLQAAIVIQIESVAALNNLDAILEACRKDIDAVWFGTLDCRVSMGLVGMPGPEAVMEPEWLEMVRKFEGIMRRWDMPNSGFAIGSGEGREVMGRGKCLLGVGVDIFSILESGIGALKSCKEDFAVMKKL